MSAQASQAVPGDAELASAPLRSDLPVDAGRERRNVVRLIRVMAAFIAWPAWSGAIAFWVYDAAEHWLHMVTLFAVGAAAIVGFAAAPQLAARFVKDA